MTEAELRALAPAPLDAALGLALHGFEDGAAVLRLEPPALAVGSEEPEYLHGGVLATCVDTAAWYAVVLRARGRLGHGRPALRLPAPGRAGSRTASRRAACAPAARSRSPT